MLYHIFADFPLIFLQHSLISGFFFISVVIQKWVITKLCRRQAEVIQNHENEHVHYEHLTSSK
jgi:hypothetical protein